ncbi:unnamed protein product [Sphagnum balticum]
MAPVFVALRTAHTQVSLAISDIRTALNEKANVVHYHVSSDITDLTRPERLVYEGTVQSDNVTVPVPWTLTSSLSVDVYINGLIQFPSTLSLSSDGNSIILGNSQTAGTPVYVVYYAAVTSSGSITSEPVQSSTPTSPSGGGVSATNFISISASDFLSSGSGIPDGSTIFQSVNPSLTSDGGFEIDQDDTIFNGYTADNWLTGSSTGFNPPVIYINSVESDVFTNAIGGLDANATIFQSRGAGDFSSSGGGIASGDTIVISAGASTWQ